ncbi:MAG: hypothetical protein ABI193_01655 [Minicystis sp.]
MKIGARGSLERLVEGDVPPIGAVFCSFTFDPAFFEEQVLRAVLRIGSDPSEQPARFHEEVRRALQEVPVACVVDAGARSPGQRLPYDLLEVHSRVHHPKLALILFDDHARIAVGSGNLSRGGFGDNSELLFVVDLGYDDPSDAEILRSVDAFVTADLALTRNRGTQADLVLRSLRGRIAATDAGDSAPLLFVDSFRGPILDALLALVPDDARVLRAGLLAPFLEQDDADAHDVKELRSVLGRIAGLRRDKGFILDLGTIWDQNILERPSELPDTLDEALGRLWVQRTKTGDGIEISFATLRALTAKSAEMLDAQGQARRRPRAELQDALDDGTTWPLGPLEIHAPANVLRVVQEELDLSLWLHPSWRIEAGKAVHRPLHAKLLTLTIKRRGKVSTLVYIGSANGSRRALLQGVDAGGNIECGVVFRVEDALGIADFAPELVNVDPALVQCRERTFAPARRNLAICVESAIHDAVARTLVITFAKDALPLTAWTLEYDGDVVGSGDALPAAPLVIEDFTLRAHCCELVLVVGDERFPIPITVADLAALPSSPALADLSLRELLALLGARVGRERLTVIRTERSPGGMRPVLDAIFGEGFGPNDIFRAWQGAAEQLASPSLSFAGFRARLDGAIGVRALWSRIRDAALATDAEVREESLSRDEGWFYGSELARTLWALALPDERDHDEKRQALDAFLESLRLDLEGLRPTDAERRWVRRICDFYETSREKGSES